MQSSAERPAITEVVVIFNRREAPFDCGPVAHIELCEPVIKRNSAVNCLIMLDFQ